jgi:hypothetical protein
MPRKPRIENSENIYHIINRGNYRSFIFETADHLAKHGAARVDHAELKEFNHPPMGSLAQGIVEGVGENRLRPDSTTRVGSSPGSIRSSASRS